MVYRNSVAPQLLLAIQYDSIISRLQAQESFRRAHSAWTKTNLVEQIQRLHLGRYHVGPVEHGPCLLASWSRNMDLFPGSRWSIRWDRM